MNQKKIVSAIIIGVLFSSLIMVSTPRVSGASVSIHQIYARLYINGELAPDNTQVYVSCPEKNYQTIINTDLFCSGTICYNIDIGFKHSDGYTGKTVYLRLSHRTQQYPVLLNKNKGDVGSIALYFLDLYYTNEPPGTPSNPYPSDDANNVNINTDLGWACVDPDGDPLTYEVYFGATNPPPIASMCQSSNTYDPGLLEYNTRYYWRVVARDPFGLTTFGPIWSFNTQSSTGGTGGGGGGGGGGTGGGVTPPVSPVNNPPTAVPGGPYTGFVGESIKFNGGGSYDNDTTNIITRYDWRFFDGDNWRINIGPTPSYTYSNPGVYTVTLRVFDDEGSNSTGTTIASILKGNNPPSKPSITGPNTGKKNQVYNYSFVSTDIDNDTLQYIIDWGDSIGIISTFYPQGVPVTLPHSWNAAGIYFLSAKVSDNQTESGLSKFTVLIDVVYVGSYGYLLDNDSDGVYDVFMSNLTNSYMPLQMVNGRYTIDTDNDGSWDIEYDQVTGAVSMFSFGNEFKGFPSYIPILALICILLILVVVIFLAMRGKKKTGSDEGKTNNKDRTPSDKKNQ
ncbi:MAG: PKD domain-containing protein [Candidatus Thermoplasmatota archaeon]